MISITRYDRLTSDISARFLIVQNTFDYNELYVIALEEIDFNGRYYCYSLELPACMSFGVYNFWLTNEEYSPESINKLDVPDTIIMSGNLIEIGKKAVLINGMQLSVGLNKRKICVKGSGMLKHKRVNLYGCSR